MAQGLGYYKMSELSTKAAIERRKQLFVGYCFSGLLILFSLIIIFCALVMKADFFWPVMIVPIVTQLPIYWVSRRGWLKVGGRVAC